jgi:hypothetical protein
MSVVTSSEKLLFLISQPRAGSTLLQRILAGHPEVYTTAEPWLMLHPVYALRDVGHDADYDAALAYKALQDFLGTLDEGKDHYFEALRRMALYLYGTACEHAGKSYFLDKTPRYFLIIPELAAIFPRAHFIVLLRNPLAVLASILNTWVRGDWIRLSRHRDNLLTAPRLLLEGIQHLNGRALVVHYENLVSRPTEQVVGLCAHLGLDFYPDMLEYGNRSAPPGRMGDPTGIERHVRPTAQNLDLWLELGRSRQTRHFLEAYLADLGPELLAGLGYDHTELEARLRSVPCRRGGIAVSWNQVFAPKKTLWNQICLITVELLQSRQLSRSSKQFARLLMRNCQGESPSTKRGRTQ